MSKSPEVFGSLEEIRFPDWDLETIAKIDTGAYSGALHVEGLHMEKVGSKSALVFRPLSAAEQEVKLFEFKRHKVKNSSGVAESRYIVPIELEIAGKIYHTMIGLTDRTGMTFPIIIGRQFLYEHNIVVDVKRNDHLRPLEGAY